MIIGSISENKEVEKRVSITPEIAKKYISNGFEIFIEDNFGLHLGISNEKFIDEGCKIDVKENILKKADIILQLNLPDENCFQYFKENSILIGNFNSSQNLEKINHLNSKKNINFFH